MGQIMDFLHFSWKTWEKCKNDSEAVKNSWRCKKSMTFSHQLAGFLKESDLGGRGSPLKTGQLMRTIHIFFLNFSWKKIEKKQKCSEVINNIEKCRKSRPVKDPPYRLATPRPFPGARPLCKLWGPKMFGLIVWTLYCHVGPEEPETIVFSMGVVFCFVFCVLFFL